MRVPNYTVQRVCIAAGLLMALLSWPGCSSPPPSPGVQARAQTQAVSPYENLIVKRPGTSSEDGKVYLVREGKKRWVVNAAWFAANGYRFPEDVREIPAAELDAIPAGEPIQ